MALLSSLGEPVTTFTVAGTVLAGYLAARLGSSVFSELKNVLFSRVAQAVSRQAAVGVFSHLLRLDSSFYTKANPGGLSRAIDRGIKGINFSFTALLFNMLPTAVEIGLVCGVMTYSFGWTYASVTGGMLAAYTIFTSRVSTWRTRFRRDLNAAEAEASVRAHDALVHHEAVKNCTRETWETSAYTNALQKYEHAALQTSKSLFYLNTGQQAILSAALTSVMWMASGSVLDSTMTVGDLVMLNALIFQLSLPLNFLGTMYRELKQSFVDMEALLGLLKLESKIKSKSGAPVLTVSRGAVEFKNVSFSYETERPLLKNLSFTVEGGQRVAFVGPSGAGKSTLARLLLRHCDPKSGSIQIDGQDITEVNLQDLRRAVGIVNQDTLLFNRSLAFNIGYAAEGDPEAVSEQQIKAAAEAAALPLSRFSNGLKTLVGERGVMLSGGERQRVAIARLILRDTPVMIFDESTASLDSETEKSILQSLDRLPRSKTMIFIAHRLTSVTGMDRIFVLNEEGRIVQSGKHEELLKDTSGLYYRLWDAQMSRK